MQISLFDAKFKNLHIKFEYRLTDGFVKTGKIPILEYFYIKILRLPSGSDYNLLKVRAFKMRSILGFWESKVNFREELRSTVTLRKFKSKKC